MFFQIVVRVGIPPGTPTFPCQGAVLFGGMISHHAGSESNASKTAVMQTTQSMGGFFKGAHLGRP